MVVHLTEPGQALPADLDKEFEAHQRERLCCHIARAAVAVKRLPVNARGQMASLLKTPCRDGTCTRCSSRLSLSSA
jgi:hypothetical protein